MPKIESKDVSLVQAFTRKDFISLIRRSLHAFFKIKVNEKRLIRQNF